MLVSDYTDNNDNESNQNVSGNTDGTCTVYVAAILQLIELMQMRALVIHRGLIKTLSFLPRNAL